MTRNRGSDFCCAVSDMRVLLVVVAICGLSWQAEAQDAQALRARHAALRAQLADNDFGRPVHVESGEAGGAQRGAIYAVIDQPFTRVAEGLARPAQWCDVMIVQPNVKNCAPGEERIALFVARKASDALERAYRVDLAFERAAAGADYLRVGLGAAEGPFGTSDYRIRLEATPLEGKRTFVHLAYAYTLKSTARMGMSMYLATTGRDKVGFSVVDRTAEGRPVHVAGMRGVVERNTMRYYLALEAYLGTLDSPAEERVEKRLRAFHMGLERHPRQLHELELAEYLELKRRDAARMLRAQR